MSFFECIISMSWNTRNSKKNRHYFKVDDISFFNILDLSSSITTDILELNNNIIYACYYSVIASVVSFKNLIPTRNNSENNFFLYFNLCPFIDVVTIY